MRNNLVRIGHFVFNKDLVHNVSYGLVGGKNEPAAWRVIVTYTDKQKFSFDFNNEESASYVLDKLSEQY